LTHPYQRLLSRRFTFEEPTGQLDPGDASVHTLNAVSMPSSLIPELQFDPNLDTLNAAQMPYSLISDDSFLDQLPFPDSLSVSDWYVPA
jgi:hypothetical protein